MARVTVVVAAVLMVTMLMALSPCVSAAVGHSGASSGKATAGRSALLASDDSNDSLYDVRYVGPEATSERATALESVPTERWMVMTASNGTKYDCAFAAPLERTAADILADREKLKGQPVPAASASAVHKALDGSCTMSPRGWWVYEACWGKHVRQYHAGSNGVVETEFKLGLGPSHEIKKGATRALSYGEHNVHGMYVAAAYLNGTLCDLTQEPREVEVRVACDNGDDPSTNNGAPVSLAEIDEVGTCKYVVTLKSRAVCELPELRRETRPMQVITCYQRPLSTGGAADGGSGESGKAASTSVKG